MSLVYWMLTQLVEILKKLIVRDCRIQQLSLSFYTLFGWAFPSEIKIKRKVRVVEWLNEASERRDSLQGISRSDEKAAPCIARFPRCLCCRWEEACVYICPVRELSLVEARRLPADSKAQIADCITRNPASKQSQLTGPIVDFEFWTTLKHPT